MNWFDENDVQSKLKDVPKFKMSEWSAEQIKSNLTNIPVKPQKSRSRKGVTALKSVGVALSGAAVAVVVLTNIPSHHLSNSHLTTGAGGSSVAADKTSSTHSGTSISTVQTPYSYFGIKASLKPMIPVALTQGYQVKASELDVVIRDKSSSYFRGDRYSGLYIDPKNQAQIGVSEITGNSMSDDTFGASHMTVPWKTTKQVNGQTYYIHPLSTTDGFKSNIVGFVRDHVVYELSSPQVSTDALLGLAKGELQPAQVTRADSYAGETYRLAANNITFKPLMLPNSLSSTWKLHSIGSDVTKSANSGFQQVSMEYWNAGNQLFDVIEMPLKDASQSGLGKPIYSKTKTWNDYKHGLAIEVSGNISQAELNQIVSAMQASK